MIVGPKTWGPGRRDIWVAPNSNLTDKLKHFLPRLRVAIPNLTDVVLPEEAEESHRIQVRQAEFFVETFAVARGSTPANFADRALARMALQGTGALDLNFEGSAITDLPDPANGKLGLAEYIRRTVTRIRVGRGKKNLPLRINVVPYKGAYLPVSLIQDDPNLYVCAQGYGGNMQIQFAASEVLQDLTDWGVPKYKANVMHAVACETGPMVAGQRVRECVLPVVRETGAFYIDDLLLDMGLLS